MRASRVERWLILIMKEVNSNAMLSYGQPEDKDVDLPNVFFFNCYFLTFVLLLSWSNHEITCKHVVTTIKNKRNPADRQNLGCSCIQHNPARNVPATRTNEPMGVFWGYIGHAFASGRSASRALLSTVGKRKPGRSDTQEVPTRSQDKENKWVYVGGLCLCGQLPAENPHEFTCS